MPTMESDANINIHVPKPLAMLLFKSGFCEFDTHSVVPVLCQQWNRMQISIYMCLTHLQCCCLRVVSVSLIHIALCLFYADNGIGCKYQYI